MRRGAPAEPGASRVLEVNPDTLELQDGFSRDVRHIGHFGTGDLELRIKSAEDLERAMPYAEKSYDNS